MGTITVEAAKHMFTGAIKAVKAEQDAIDHLMAVRKRASEAFSKAYYPLKGLYFLTDVGIVHISKARGGVLTVRKANTRTIEALRRRPWDLVDVRTELEAEGIRIGNVQTETEPDIDPGEEA